MKKMKKVLSLVLAMVMILSLGTSSVQAAGRGQDGWSGVTYGASESKTEALAEAPAEEPAAPAEESEEPAAPAEEPATPVEEPAAPAEEPAAPAEEPAAPAEEPAAPAEEPAAPVEETVSYPAVTLAGATENGVAVRVESPEGALPEGAYMTLKDVSAEEVQAKVSDEISGRILTAVDITFHDSADNEIQPNGNVAVSIKAPELAEAAAQDLGILHINEEKAVAEELTEAENAVEVNAADENAVAFESDAFSIYAVIDGSTDDEARATVIFHGINDQEVATYYVKNSDQLLGDGERQDNVSYIEDIVVDPGIGGALPAGQYFMGWYIGESSEGYTASTKHKDIKDIRTYLSDLSITEGMTVNVWAMIFKVYSVTYLDEQGISRGSDDKYLLLNEDTVEYTVSKDYTPADPTKSFLGWITDNDANISNAMYEGTAVEEPYKLGTTMTISGSITFTVDAPRGRWLVFDENGSGATYNAPQFVRDGNKTVKPELAEDEKMLRLGYEFKGWFTEKYADNAEVDENKRFVFGEELTEPSTTIYAKWDTVAAANYVVIIWKQNVNDAKDAADTAKTYDFAESWTVEGNVGSAININRNGNTVSLGSNSYTAPTGFTYRTMDTGKTVSAQGNTVVNVYFDRDLITLTFQYRQNNRWQTQATMTGLYGSSLASNGYTWPTNRWWYKSYSSSWGSYSGSGTRTTFLDAFILANGASSQTYYGFTGDGNRTVHFLKEDPDQEGTFIQDIEVETSNGTFNISDKYNGYKAVSYSTNNSTWTTLGEKDSSTGYYASIENYSNLYIRYSPMKYSIIFMDGAYVDGNGNPITDAINLGSLNVVENIIYESDVSTYNEGGASYYDPTTKQSAPGYAFEGWYIDDACTQAYTFTSMPEGITVYAKWRQVQYRVFLHPEAKIDGQNDSTLNWGSDNQQMNFRISYGGQLSTPTGLRDEYEFIGWFLEDGSPFNMASKFTDNIVKTPYDKTAQENWTDSVNGNPMNKFGEVEGEGYNSDAYSRNAETGVLTPRDRFWITKKLDLYGKWSAKLTGAEGIGVIYNANGGSGAPDDTRRYKDNVDAVAQAASTAPADKKFLYWVVQSWDEAAGEYADTTTHVFPGDTFTVLKANARVSEIGPQPGEEGYVEGEEYLAYTVQLRAEYGPAEAAKDTHIEWYRNWTAEDTEATSLLHKDENLQINQAVDIYTIEEGIPTRAGYKFLGWARMNEKNGETTIFYHEVTANDLFLKWDSDNSKYQAKNSSDAWVDVTQVAADEILPYQALYAVWEARPCYYVFHSATGMLNAYDVPESGTVNLKDMVSENHLYGGYYSAYGAYSVTDPDKAAAEAVASDTGVKVTTDDAQLYTGASLTYTSDGGKKVRFWTKSDAKTVAGTAVTPTEGDVYYLKEVPTSYLLTDAKWVYDVTKDTHDILYMYLITVIDDRYYDEIGYKIIETDKETTAIAAKFTVVNQENGTKSYSDPITAADYAGIERGYLGIVDGSTEVIGGLKSGSVYIQPYWKTLDGVYVRAGGYSISTKDGSGNVTNDNLKHS